MRGKEFTPHGKQMRVQNSLNSREIYFRVFRVGVIAMHQQSGSAERQKPGEGEVSLRLNCISPMYFLNSAS